MRVDPDAWSLARTTATMIIARVQPGQPVAQPAKEAVQTVLRDAGYPELDNNKWRQLFSVVVSDMRQIDGILNR